MERTPTAEPAAPGAPRRPRRRGWRGRRGALLGGLLLVLVAGAALAPPHFLRSRRPDRASTVEFTLANATGLDAALVITSEDTGEQQVLWLSHGELDKPWVIERFAGPMRLAVVASDLATGPLTTGECDLTVPLAGTTTIELNDDGTATVLTPEDRSAGKGEVLSKDPQWRSLVAASGGKAPFLEHNGSSRHARLTLRADDGTTRGQYWLGCWQGWTGARNQRPWIPGEHLRATWELAAPVTTGGAPVVITEPGDLSLQVNLFPDGRWEISESSLASAARIRFADLWGGP